MKITINCNEKRANIILQSLDIFSRILMGQFTEIEQLFRFNNFETCSDDLYKKTDEINKLLIQVRDIIYPDLKGYGNGSFGIFNPKCPQESKIAYDIYQILERALYNFNKENKKDFHPHKCHRCEFSPLKSGNEEFVEIEIEKY
jgi:hypothetical protein